MNNTALNIVFSSTHSYLASPQTARPLALYLYRTPHDSASASSALVPMFNATTSVLYSAPSRISSVLSVRMSKIVYLMSSSGTSVYSTGESLGKSRVYSPGVSIRTHFP